MERLRGTIRSRGFQTLLVKLAQEHRPEVILAGATTRGRDLLGTASVDLNSGAIADREQIVNLCLKCTT